MISGSFLPLLLVCGLFALILAVGIGCSYVWLVWLGKEATRCPKCGKVFEIIPIYNTKEQDKKCSDNMASSSKIAIQKKETNLL